MSRPVVTNPDGTKTPQREICWVYGDDGEGKDVVLTVSAFAARPESKATDEALLVQFENLDVKWRDEV